MTKDPFKRIAHLCAAAGISTAEFREFANFVSYEDPEYAARLYGKLRSNFRAYERSSDNDLFEAHSQGDLLTQAVTNDVARLVDEAGITGSHAVELLSQELLKQDSDLEPDDLRFSSKEGFKRWLSRATRIAGDSAVLSAAAKVFGVQGSERHWRLSK